MIQVVGRVIDVAGHAPEKPWRQDLAGSGRVEFICDESDCPRVTKRKWVRVRLGRDGKREYSLPRGWAFVERIEWQRHGNVQRLGPIEYLLCPTCKRKEASK